jgi:DNA-binding transcriptional ArsR family regulator
MKRTELASITTMTQERSLKPLVKAGIVTLHEQVGEKGRGTKAHGTRNRIIVSLNAAFPAYKELRTLLLTLADKPAPRVHDLSTPRDEYDPNLIFNTPTLLKALLLMNAVKDCELDVASLNRLRPEHAPFTLHGRMKWMLDEGIIWVRVEGLVRYYSLNPEYRAYQPLKLLLDRIAKAWPDLVDAADFNDDLKPAIRLTRDRNAKKRANKKR